MISRREMAQRYKIKYFYDIQNRADFHANPDYKGVCHVALAQEGHTKPGPPPPPPFSLISLSHSHTHTHTHTHRGSALNAYGSWYKSLMIERLHRIQSCRLVALIPVM